MSGIVGKIRRRFCIFGDTVNMASRTETSCPPGCVQVTEETYRLAAPDLCPSEVVFDDRGEVAVKGAAVPIRMYLARQGLEGGGPSNSSSRDLATVVASAPRLLSSHTTTEQDSFGSTMLPRPSNFQLDSAGSASYGGSQAAGLVVLGRSSSTAAQLIMEWEE